jgi:hypothetical protein
MKPQYFWGLVAAGAVLTACDGSTTAGAGPDAGSDAISGDDASSDATGASDASHAADAVEGSPGTGDAATETGTPGVQCGPGGTPSFPTFDKSCSTDADCALAVHTLSCCGNVLVMAVNKAAIPAFQAAESTCESQFPGCGCASNSVGFENGVAYGDTGNPTAAAAASCTGHSCIGTYTGPTFACGDRVCAQGADYCEVFSSADGAPPTYECVFTGVLAADAGVACGSFAIAAGCTCAQSQGNVTVTCH